MSVWDRKRKSKTVQSLRNWLWQSCGELNKKIHRIGGREVSFSRIFESRFKKCKGQRDNKLFMEVQIKSLWSDCIPIICALHFLCDNFDLDLFPARTASHNWTTRSNPHWNKTQGVSPRSPWASQYSVELDRGYQPLQPALSWLHSFMAGLPDKNRNITPL